MEKALLRAGRNDDIAEKALSLLGLGSMNDWLVVLVFVYV